jgi:hypothetical protein
VSCWNCSGNKNISIEEKSDEEKKKKEEPHSTTKPQA